MDLFQGIFTSTYFNLISVIFGLTGIILAYFCYRSKKPCWAIRGHILVKGYSSKIGELDFRFKDRQIENLSISRIVFWNQGKETLNRHDIETANPLRIQADTGIDILDVSIYIANRSSSQFEVKLENNQKSATIDFDYLDKEHGAVIQIIHTGTKEPDIKIIGDIKGVKKIKKKTIPSSNRGFNS